MSDSPPSEDDAQLKNAAARVGSKLVGKWSLVRLLGVGGMAAVYEALHDNGRRVAIKMLHIELNQHPEAKERFLGEAYVANHVAHPGTVPVLDDGVAEDGSLFLVMDLLQGETVEERWQRSERVLSVLEVFQLIEPLLDILRAAHEKGIVHRDVKPENIFLTHDGEVRLLDFGIARMLDARRSVRTQIGSTMGTPAFMAPEQARGRWEDVDEQSDLWSVGATMFTLVCGTTVHTAETNNELLLASMTQPAPPVRTFAPDIMEEAAAVIDRALAFEKADRFSCAADMLEAVRSTIVVLEEARRARGFSSKPPVRTPTFSSFPPSPSTFRPVAMSEMPTVAEPSSKSSHYRALLAAALLASTAIGYIVVSGSSSTDPERATASQAHGTTIVESVGSASIPEGDIPNVPSAPGTSPTSARSSAAASSDSIASSDREKSLLEARPSSSGADRTAATRRLSPSRPQAPPSGAPTSSSSVPAKAPNTNASAETRLHAPAGKAARATREDNEGKATPLAEPPEDFDPLSLRR